MPIFSGASNHPGRAPLDEAQEAVRPPTIRFTDGAATTATGLKSSHLLETDGYHACRNVIKRQ
jgi:hypothetical protein